MKNNREITNIVPHKSITFFFVLSFEYNMKYVTTALIIKAGAVIRSRSLRLDTEKCSLAGGIDRKQKANEEVVVLERRASLKPFFCRVLVSFGR